MHTTLISAEELQHALQEAHPPLVFDFSFDLADAQKGLAQYEATHIAGAVYAHLDRHLSNKSDPDGAMAGRHPLPSPEVFAAWLASAGLQNGQQVVVYDRQGANYSGRLWWMLKWVGHEAVAVLDGGLQAWQTHGGAIESGPSMHRVALESDRFELKAPLTPLLTTQEIAGRLGDPSMTVIDARAAARFRGEIEPLDPVAGHIPGALNRPFADNIDANGRFKPAAQLRAEFETLLAGRDASTVVHHCGSGVSAIPNLLGMEVAGLGRSALYPGSWSAWCNTPGMPVAKG